MSTEPKPPADPAGLHREGLNRGLVTFATPESNARPDVKPQSPSSSSEPWNPTPWAMGFGSIIVGVLAALGPLLASPGIVLSAPLIIGTVLTGAGTGLAAFLGMRSSGKH